MQFDAAAVRVVGVVVQPFGLGLRFGDVAAVGLGVGLGLVGFEGAFDGEGGLAFAFEIFGEVLLMVGSRVVSS